MKVIIERVRFYQKTSRCVRYAVKYKKHWWNFRWKYLLNNAGRQMLFGSKRQAEIAANNLFYTK